MRAMLSGNGDIEAMPTLRMQYPAAHLSRVPSAGERAAGHGVSGIVVAVPSLQPLAAHDVWRVTLAGESCGRLVRPSSGGGWHLLQLDELTDDELDALEAALERDALERDALERDALGPPRS